LPPIHFDFMDLDEPNATAFVHKGQYFIGLTTGAAIGMTFLFKRMLSDCRILPDLGNLQEEHDYQNRLLTRPILPSLRLDMDRNGEIPAPKGHRREYFEFLAQMAAYFLILHEITHIESGHVDYIDCHFLAECGGKQNDRDTAILTQCLEVDADVGAAGVAFRMMDDIRRDSPYYCPQIQTYEGRLIALSMAILSFFRSFQDEPLAGANLLAHQHPPDRFRFSALLGAIPGAVSNQPGTTLERAMRMFFRGSRLTEEAFHVLTGDPKPDYTSPDQIPYAEALGPVGIKHRELLRKRWEGGLRDELLRHAYAPPMTYTE